jgi:hypothetical protein
MTAALSSIELARADLAALFPLREGIARRAVALRAELASAPPSRRDQLDGRALRYERLVRLLETRIRIAAEVLAIGGAPPLSSAAFSDPDAS